MDHNLPEAFTSFRCVDWVECACSSDDRIYLGTKDEVCSYDFFDENLHEKSRQKIDGLIGLCSFKGRLFAASKSVLYILDSEDLTVEGSIEVVGIVGIVAGLEFAWVYGEGGLFGRIEFDGSVSLFDLSIHSDILSASPCGSTMALGTSASKILVLDLTCMSVNITIVHNNRHHVSQIARIESICSVSDDIIAIGDNFGDICYYNVLQPELLALQTFSMPEANPIKCLCRFRPDCIASVDACGNVSAIKDDAIANLKLSNFTLECDIVCGLNADALVLVSRFGQVHVAAY